jgi:hypothetical protein
MICPHCQNTVEPTSIYDTLTPDGHADWTKDVCPACDETI